MHWRWRRQTRPGGRSHTAWTRTASHISLSARDVLRLVITLSLFMSTLYLDIAPNRREHQFLYKVPSATKDLVACTILIVPRLYKKESYWLLWKRPIYWRYLTWHVFWRRVYNPTMDWFKESGGDTSKWGQDGTANGDLGRGSRPFYISKIDSTSQCVCLSDMCRERTLTRRLPFFRCGVLYSPLTNPTCTKNVEYEENLASTYQDTVVPL